MALTEARSKRTAAFGTDAPTLCSIALLALFAGALWLMATGSNISLWLLLGAPLLLGLAICPALDLWFGAPRSRRRLSIWALATLPLNLSLCLWHWPLRANFTMSEHALDRLVARVSAGEKIAYPQRAGGFMIVGAERRGSIMLITNPHPSGNEGLVWSDHPENGPGFNPWSEVRLNRNWWLVRED